MHFVEAVLPDPSSKRCDERKPVYLAVAVLDWEPSLWENFGATGRRHGCNVSFGVGILDNLSGMNTSGCNIKSETPRGKDRYRLMAFAPTS